MASKGKPIVEHRESQAPNASAHPTGGVNPFIPGWIRAAWLAIGFGVFGAGFWGFTASYSAIERGDYLGACLAAAMALGLFKVGAAVQARSLHSWTEGAE